MAVPVSEARFLPFEPSIGMKAPELFLDNPHVCSLLVTFSRQLRSAGYRKYSMDAVYHRVRWHINVETRKDPQNEFKVE
jgi:hypothetical protein